MSHALDQDPVSADAQRTSNGVNSPEPVQPSEADRATDLRSPAGEVDRAVSWGRQRPRITIGAATLLAIAASAATAITIRRRQRREIGRLVWLMTRANALRSATSDVPPAARAGGVAGGMGGTLLLAALLGARARARRSEVEELGERLAELESLASSRRPRAKDLAIGGAIGMVLGSACARAVPRRSPPPES